VVAKALLLRAPPKAHEGYSRMCLTVLCFARVSCSPHRPCCVPFLAPSQHGKTAFYLAAENGHVAAMEFFLAHGADPNAKDKVPVLAPLEAYGLRVKERGGKDAALHEGLS